MHTVPIFSVQKEIYNTIVAFEYIILHQILWRQDILTGHVYFVLKNFLSLLPKFIVPKSEKPCRVSQSRLHREWVGFS